MNGFPREDDPERACARLEREACDRRIESRALLVFFVVLLAAMLLAARGSAEVVHAWRAAISAIAG